MADQAEDMETATTANEEPMDTSNSEVQAQVQTSQNENSETGGNDNPSSIETENMETVTKDDSSNVLPSEDKTGQDTPMDENTSKSEEADALKEGESSKEEPETTKEDSSNESSQPEPRKDDFFSKLIDSKKNNDNSNEEDGTKEETKTETPDPSSSNEDSVDEKPPKMKDVSIALTKIDMKDESSSQDSIPFVTQIVDKDLAALDEELASDSKKPKVIKITKSDEKPSICKKLQCANCSKDVEGSVKALAWNMEVFCDEFCLKKYQRHMCQCYHCENAIGNQNLGKYSAHCEKLLKLFCSPTCLEDQMDEEKVCCLICDEPGTGYFEVQGDKGLVKFQCSRDCFEDYAQIKGKKGQKRPMIKCAVCGEEKTHATSLMQNGKEKKFCGDPCLSAYKYAQSLNCEKCDFCKCDFVSTDIYTSVFDFEVKIFCSNKCQYYFRIENNKPVNCGWCKVLKPECSQIFKNQGDQYYCSNHCMYMQKVGSQNGELKKNVRNKGTMKRPTTATKGVSVKPQPVHKGTQSEIPAQPTLVPCATPMYMPVPMQMYQRPFPIPIPIPLPIPVPIFIPTTRNSTRGIKKFLKKMKAKLPSNVFEAQILEMAGAAAGEDGDALDSDDSLYEDYDDENDEKYANSKFQHPAQPKLPNEDVETIIKAGNIVPKPLPHPTPDACPSPTPFGYRGSPTPRLLPGIKQEENSWQYKRMPPHRNRQSNNRGRRQSRPIINVETNPALAALTLPPKERPDAKHHLKFTYGVNAWRHWVVGKNAELEKARAQGKYMKPFETDILKLRADELNYTLCMFVKEVRKPNNDHYASDSILYLTLGIQEYLFENGRIDNIFTDMYYEPFTSALHEVIKDFKLPINELGYFVTRIEEEHLWEAKQLGAHSPQVLLNTLIYFNAKYFMMKTLDDHTKLSFTHIMKHWKKGGTATPATKNPPVPGEKRTTLLRYYPPAHLKGPRHDDRKCFEQQELPEQPLRCPVKLYEFYLSHCPESAKSKSDMFYLQPERSCVPDSPVWYSVQPLNSFQLEKMLARILMVREVQEHMLADAAAHHA